MEDILVMMQNIIKLQSSVIQKFDELKDDMYFDALNKSQVSFNIDIIEKIEKYHFQLWLFTSNSYKILEQTKNQMKLIKKYSDLIRAKINKVQKINNSNKFIDIIKCECLHSNDLKQLLLPANNYSFKDVVCQNGSDVGDYSVKKTVSLANVALTKIDVVDKLENISGMFNWFEGNSRFKKGIYLALCKNFVVQVPFPNLIGKNSANFKHKTIPCKYKDVKTCSARQLELSRRYGSEVRTCNYVHVGEKFIKIGSDYRCPGLSSFGCHETLCDDISNVSLQDIKWILMNATSDLLLILLWYENHKNMGEIILSDLDTL